MSHHRFRILMEAMDLLRESIEWREGGREILSNLLALAASCATPASFPLPLKLPMQLRAYCPPHLMLETWRNALHIFYRLDYEQLEEFRPREGWTVLDVGAFIGLYTLRAARLVGARGTVISVEPLNDNLKYLTLNVTVNSLRNVTLVAGCAWVSWGEALMYVPGSAVNATLSRKYAEAMGGASRVVRVRCLPLDSLIKMTGGVDLLKIDVEGAELHLVRGSPGIRPGLVDRVVIEVHTDVVRPSEIAEALEERGYGVFVYLPGDSPLQAFVYAR